MALSRADKRGIWISRTIPQGGLDYSFSPSFFLLGNDGDSGTTFLTTNDPGDPNTYLVIVNPGPTVIIDFAAVNIDPVTWIIFFNTAQGTTLPEFGYLQAPNNVRMTATLPGCQGTFSGELGTGEIIGGPVDMGNATVTVQFDGISAAVTRLDYAGELDSLICPDVTIGFDSTFVDSVTFVRFAGQANFTGRINFNESVVGVTPYNTVISFFTANTTFLLQVTVTQNPAGTNQWTILP